MAAAIARWAGRGTPRSVLDPAVGGGAFLLAAHTRLPGAALHGIDIDADAVEVATRALALAGATTATVAHGDGLDPAVAPRTDLIVGNPPFLSQLRTTTSRDEARRRRLREWYGDAAAGYVDEAGLFVLAASRLLNPGGAAVLVVPEALLATESAVPVRAVVAERCDIEVVWRDTDRVFPGVDTCAIALTVRATGNRGTADWGRLLVDDVPVAGLDTTALPTIASVATATADFRDAYYLVADHAAEQRPGHDDPRITPVGLIDPAHCRWGTTTVRFAKHRWERPVAVGLPDAFLETRLGPKLLVATQTKVLEALVDPDGDLLPTTPAITVRTDRPWHVGAALTSPVVTAIAARRHAGAARARSALKLSAKQVLALPLPADRSTAWDDAATAYQQAHTTTDADRRHALLTECGSHMATAYGTPENERLRAWWTARLPRR